MDDITLPPLPEFDPERHAAITTAETGRVVFYSEKDMHAYARAAIAADRAKGAQQGEAVATVRVHKTGGNAGLAWSAVPVEDAPLLVDGTKLFTRPAPAPETRGALKDAASLAMLLQGFRGNPDGSMEEAMRIASHYFSTSPAHAQDAEQAAMYRELRDNGELPYLHVWHTQLEKSLRGDELDDAIRAATLKEPS